MRVLKSCGEIMTENGPVMLDAGSTHFLKRFVEFLVQELSLCSHVMMRLQN